MELHRAAALVARSPSVPFSAVYGALETANEAESGGKPRPARPLQYSFLDHCCAPATAQAPKSDADRASPPPPFGRLPEVDPLRLAGPPAGRRRCLPVRGGHLN